MAEMSEKVIFHEVYFSREWSFYEISQGNHMTLRVRIIGPPCTRNRKPYIWGIKIHNSCSCYIFLNTYMFVSFLCCSGSHWHGSANGPAATPQGREGSCLFTPSQVNLAVTMFGIASDEEGHLFPINAPSTSARD